MALRDLSDPQAVVAALDEFDRLGRETFLQKYGFGPARRYLVRRGPRRYDSKAIAAAAHAIELPGVPGSSETRARPCSVAWKAERRDSATAAL